MVLLQPFATILFLLHISVKSYCVPYEGILDFSATSRLIYSASEHNPILTGYSYATQDFNGDGSNVVFTTGVDSVGSLQNKIASAYKANCRNAPEIYSQRDTSNKISKTSISSEPTSEKVERNKTKERNLERNVEILNGETELGKNSQANNNFVEYQIPQHASFVPYAAFRTNFLNLQLPTIHTEYPVTSNAIEDQYYSHNPYARFEELPLHDFDFYDPAVPPLFYQPAITIADGSFRIASATSGDIISKVSTAFSVTREDSQANATESSLSKSNIIESRSNLEATTQDKDTKTESTTISTRAKQEIMNSESRNSTETSKASAEQNVDGKANSTEPASTEATSSTKKSSDKKCDTCKDS